MKTKGMNDYLQIVAATDNLTEMSGRYAIQKLAEKRIVIDVAEKLKLTTKDMLLEVGCGVGNLIIPLSFFVNRAIGIDHEKVIEVLRARFSADNLQLITGDFLETELGNSFDKILIYSVLHYMPDDQTLFLFLDKALSSMSASGRLLLGDITCNGRKNRFMASKTGNEFQKQWEAERITNPGTQMPPSKASYMKFTDETVLKILAHARSKGFHSYLLEQPANLPFGNTREDILIVGPEYQDTP